MHTIEQFLNFPEDGQAQQRKLFNQNLNSIQSPPMFEYPLITNNYLEGNDQVFENMCESLRFTVSQERHNKVLEEYLQNEQNIEKIEQGYLDQNRQKSMKNIIHNLREEIDNKVQYAERIEQQIEKHKLNIQTVSEELIGYRDFINRNQDILQKVEQIGKIKNNIQEQADILSKQLNETAQQLNKRIKLNLQNCFIELQKNILEAQISLDEVKQKLIQLQIEEAEAKNEVIQISKLNMNLDNKIQALEQEIQKEKQLSLEPQRRSSILNSSIKEIKENNVFLNEKSFTHIEEKTAQNKSFYYLLIAMTSILLLLTIVRICQ